MSRFVIEFNALARTDSKRLLWMETGPFDGETGFQRSKVVIPDFLFEVRERTRERTEVF